MKTSKIYQILVIALVIVLAIGCNPRETENPNITYYPLTSKRDIADSILLARGVDESLINEFKFIKVYDSIWVHPWVDTVRHYVAFLRYRQGLEFTYHVYFQKGVVICGQYSTFFTGNDTILAETKRTFTGDKRYILFMPK